MKTDNKIQNKCESPQTVVSVSVTELRIGNLVECFGIREVVAIKKHKVKVQNETEKGHFILEWTPVKSLSFRPIPITEEWLLKFGFKYDGNWHYQLGENPLTKDYLLDLCWIEDAEFPFYRNGFFKTKYIHQLQNLYFALTGSELQISSITEH